jgi:DNA-binding response OmpR family regulator
LTCHSGWSHSKWKQEKHQRRIKLKILLIEDEIKIAEFVLQGLSSAGYAVTHVDDGEQGLALMLAAQHDVAILDLMLPKLSGFDVLQQAKAACSAMPVIILSAKVDLPDRLKGFDLGADDYLPKPFFVEELLARIKLVSKRSMPDEVQAISVGHLTLDVVTRHAKWFDVTASLSQREFSLLAYLMRSPGHIYSRQQILKHVWDINFDPETNLVDVCVRRIKLKLDRSKGGHLSPIESVRGVGYRLRQEV